MSAPAVSVVIPTYNRRALLAETAASVLAQTFRDFELICADDGSTDGTRAYVAGLSDPRVRLLALDRTGNVAAVRNAGAVQARGRYLAFLDHDDLWLPAKLARQMPAMLETGARWSYTEYDHCDERGRTLHADMPAWRPLARRVARAIVHHNATIALATVVVERSLFDALDGFDESAAVAWRDDFDFLLRLALAADPAPVSGPGPLARIREHPSRMMRAGSQAAQRAAMANVCAKVRRIAPGRRLRWALRRQEAHQRTEAAAAHFEAGRWRAGARALVHAAVLGPQAARWLSVAARSALRPFAFRPGRRHAH